MIKQTLYFSKPTKLNFKNNQLMIKQAHATEIDESVIHQVAVEDIGFVVLDHQQITITQHVLQALIENKAAILVCNKNHLPIAMQLPLASNEVQTERYRAQIETSSALKKQLWQQTVKAKIKNQSNHLIKRQLKVERIRHLINEVKSGDKNNCEATAAAYYWKHIFSKEIEEFKRLREGNKPNDLLNYGYAILRAVVARALCISGLLPTFGIFHRNKYNAYCLADDIMEPYRPYVDDVVYNLLIKEKADLNLNNISVKAALLRIPQLDVMLENKKMVLMNAVERTTSTLFKCFNGTARKILYPVFYLIVIPKFAQLAWQILGIF